MDSTSSPPTPSRSTNLPADMYGLILDRLEAFDIIRFPHVCSECLRAYSWKARIKSGAPSLLTSPCDADGYEIPGDDEQGMFFIHNLSSKETFLVDVEGLKDRFWIGCKDDWLATADLECNVELLNPVTGLRHRLPSFAAFAFPRFNLSPYTFDRLKLCRTPAESGGYLAIAIFFPNVLLYTMHGSCDWTMLKNPVGEYVQHVDAIVHNGKIMAIAGNGDLWSWDLVRGAADPTLVLRSAVPRQDSMEYDFFLGLSSMKGKLVVVSSYGTERSRPRWGRRIPGCFEWKLFVEGVSIHEVDTDIGIVQEVRDIGDQALFVGSNFPFYVPVPYASGDLMANSVYISDASSYDAIVVDLKELDIPHNVKRISYPGPRDMHQMPMWFRPAFRPATE